MKLSVVISAGADLVALERLRASVVKQTTSAEIFIEANPLYPGRAKGFAASTSDLVLFLDADVELPYQDFFKDLVVYFSNHSSVDVVGGYYLNPPDARTMVRSYNQVCNLWLQVGEKKNLLGGVFCIRKSSLNEWPCTSNFWGGEDTHLFRSLEELGLKFQVEQSFSVIHHDQGSLRKLVRRAWLHGQTREIRKLETPSRYKNFWKYRSLWSEFSPAEFAFACIHYSLVTVSARFARLRA